MATTDVTARVSSTTTAATWLVAMRWHVVGGQIAAIVVAAVALQLTLPLPALGACVAVMVASNIAFARRTNVGNGLIAGVLVFDVLLLTFALKLGGAPATPLAMFYLVQILLAGLLLPHGRWVAVVTAVAIACDAYLVDHWIAFAFLACFTAHVTWRSANAVRMGQVELLRKQRIAAHAEKLASLSTLAAGAAHELGSPLGTITVAAEELDGLIIESPADAIEDARVIRDEVARCREIVHRMNARAGQLLGEVPEPTTTGIVLGELHGQLSAADRARVIVQGDLSLAIECPTRGLVRILANLVANALQASADIEAHVAVSVRRVGERVQFVVDDRGLGIPAEVSARLGEPFVTTKDPGKGMGLGLFLSFAFAELCAGRLELSPRTGGGTTALLELPCQIKVSA